MSKQELLNGLQEMLAEYYEANDWDKALLIEAAIKIIEKTPG